MNFKKTIAVVVGAAMVTLLAGCGKNETPAPANTNSRPSTVAQSSTPSTLSSSTSESSAPVSPPEPEEYVIAMTDEIVNADLGSGLVQLDNVLFQQGGYITVADFVEQYKDMYEITYNKDTTLTYDEFKDYLVEYNSDAPAYYYPLELGLGGKDYGNYYLILTPKQGDDANNRQICAYIINRTSPDKKIAVSDAVVICTSINPPKNGDSILSIWAPGGFGIFGSYFNGFSLYWRSPENLVSVNENYKINDVVAMLEEKGFTEASDFFSGNSNENEMKYKHNQWIGGKENYSFCVAGDKENLFGLVPYYQYDIFFDGNTDKIAYIYYTVKGFYEA